MADIMISARNKVEGEIVDIEKGELLAKVKIKVTSPTIITAVIVKDAIKELNIKKGDTVEAVIKATEVMIEK
ncbi:MAG: molybdopterin-binding protein [Candidatus Baldrarchaeota archaeon]